MAVYGPTGASLAGRGMTVGQGLSGMGQNMMRRAAFLEQKRQFNFQQMYQTINDMVNSENYGGDWTKFFSKNPGLSKKFLSTMYPYDPERVDWVYQGLAKGNQSAQQQAQQAIEEQLQSLKMDEAEQMMRGQNMQEMGDQGLPQAQPPDGGGQPAGGQQFTPEPVTQPQFQVPEQIGMPDIGGQTEGQTQAQPGQERGGFARSGVNPARTAYDLVQAKMQERMERLGGSGRGAYSQVKLDVVKELQNDPNIPDVVKAQLGKVGTMEKPPPEQISVGAIEPVSSTQTATEMDNLRAFHEQASQKYREVGGGEATSREQAMQAAKKAFGFNENDIETAAKELAQGGKTENKDIRAFMDKYGIAESAEGLAQIATIMNAGMLGHDIPETTDANLGLNPQYLEGRYEVLRGMLGIERSGATQPTAPVSREQEGAPATNYQEQLVSRLNEQNPNQAGPFEVVAETEAGWRVRGADGSSFFIKSARALEQGLIDLPESVRGLYDASEGMSADKALALSKRIMNPEAMTPKERRVAENEGKKVADQVKRESRKNSNREVYKKSGQDAVQSYTPQKGNAMYELLVSLEPGETRAEKERRILRRAMVPENERRLEELIRQFDITTKVKLAELALKEKLGMLAYREGKGIADAIDGLSKAKMQEAAIEYVNELLIQENKEISTLAGDNPDKYREIRIERMNRNPDFKAATNTMAQLMALITDSPVKVTEEAIERGLLGRIFKGGRVQEVLESLEVDYGISTPNVEVDETELDILERNR